MATVLILRALTGEFRGREFRLTAPAAWVLGRSPSCELHLSGDATVSRQHCLVELDGEGAWVRDLGSRNGTHVNGERIGQCVLDWLPGAPTAAPLYLELQDGDELRVCNNVFAIVLPDPPEHVAPAKEQHEIATPNSSFSADKE
jgi:pSer/pThr/pTyr-binding forkhead associated (FHA) protein